MASRSKCLQVDVTGMTGVVVIPFPDAALDKLETGLAECGVRMERKKLRKAVKQSRPVLVTADTSLAAQERVKRRLSRIAFVRVAA